MIWVIYLLSGILNFFSASCAIGLMSKLKVENRWISRRISTVMVTGFRSSERRISGPALLPIVKNAVRDIEMYKINNTKNIKYSRA